MLKKYQRGMTRTLRRRPPEAGHRTFRPQLELLEQRMAPATFRVFNTGDPAVPKAGDGSLREAILQSNNATTNPNRIIFQILAVKGATPLINLGSPLPAI